MSLSARWNVAVCLIILAICAPGRAADAPVSNKGKELPPPSIEEPIAQEFSLMRAAQSLDITASNWQTTHQCAACHTMTPYLMARPLLGTVSPEPPDARRFFEKIVAERLEPEPDLPKDGISAIVVQVAAGLAFHDRTTTGKLHPRTREELDRMWSLQRPDGSWEWPFRDTPPIKSDEHFGVTLAALAAGVAPEKYAESDAAKKGLDGIRKFLKSHPPTSLHQELMLLWAGAHVDDLLSAADKQAALKELTAAQRPDGGWSLASLVENPRNPDRQTDAGRAARAQPAHGHEYLVYVGRDKVYTSPLTSDGYATGLVIYVMRQNGVPQDDPQIRRGIAWLKTHQRASGRWFTPSQGWHTQQLIANAGTAYAVMALHACGEIPGAESPRAGASSTSVPAK